MRIWITRFLSPWARFVTVLALFIALGVIGEIYAPGPSTAGATASAKLGLVAGVTTDKAASD